MQKIKGGAPNLHCPYGHSWIAALSEMKDKGKIKEMLSKYDLTRLVEKAKGMDRKFVLHVGPTNSGKTYQSINALKEAGSGVYLGPLRLMALEVFDKLNAGGCPCTLLTGEEYEPVSDAKVTASTIELCDYQKRYDVAVIDEAQLIGDAARGANWTKAIFAVNAAVVHICMAPEAESLIKHLLEDIQAPYEIVRHERLTPLTFAGKLTRLDDVRPGDALITFSRRGVLSLAAELEKSGRKASVIYGALPPAARREEVRRFESGETSVVVATDAIGMGISLPIKRTIFCSTEKFNGVINRSLLPAEIKQIAGRAGRYGIHGRGEVLALKGEKLIKGGLYAPYSLISTLSIPFPKEALNSEYKLSSLIRCWNELVSERQKGSFSERQNFEEAETLLEYLEESLDNYDDIPKSLLFKMITCPVDSRSDG